jgi:YgiT-type zinc finger domain-containing protein
MKRCHFCGGTLIEQMTTFLYEDNNQVWVIRNVPAFVCTQCGEKEYTQETTHRVLMFLKQPSPPADFLRVPAYDLAMAVA